MLRKGFTYFLIYYYFFFSSVVCAGTYPRVGGHEVIGIEDQRVRPVQPKQSHQPLEKGKDSDSLLSSANRGFFSQIKERVENAFSKAANTTKEAVLEKIDDFSKWAYEELKHIPSLTGQRMAQCFRGQNSLYRARLPLGKWLQ